MLLPYWSAASTTASPLISINAVIVTAIKGEVDTWVHKLPLGESLPFDWGAMGPHAELHVNRSLGVMALSTGQGPAKAATSIMALGFDPRLDLKDAYWIVAGIAGVDPAVGSMASVFVPRFLIDADAASVSLDSVGQVPKGRDTVDYGPPWPSQSEAHKYVLQVDAALVSWALHLDGSLPDGACSSHARSKYTEPAARKAPQLLAGESTSGEVYWAGRSTTSWARNITTYWSGGRGTFALTQMEDFAFATSLQALGRAHKVNATRLVVLRGASDYSYEPTGAKIDDWFFSREHYCSEDAHASLFAAGMPLVEDVLAGRAP